VTYVEIRECIVLAQNNIQLADDETFKLASVACLSSLWDVEEQMSAGGPPSVLPWNRFLTENIIALLPTAPLPLSDVRFLALVLSLAVCVRVRSHVLCAWYCLSGYWSLMKQLLRSSITSQNGSSV
jgi:hypothetical protein